MDAYLSETALCDYRSAQIQALVGREGWQALDDYGKIAAVYAFVRDRIAFGYNVSDTIPATQVLRDGYGQCNTKGTLFAALLRAVGIPCRIHGFTIDKALQKGAMTGFVYRGAPARMIHSWVEVRYGDRWLELEGLILDKPYLTALQSRFSACRGAFCGYGVAVSNFENPPVDFAGDHTYIQSEGIAEDFGVYDSPDAFFAAHPQPLTPWKEFLFRHIGRRAMNDNVRRVRMSAKRKESRVD